PKDGLQNDILVSTARAGGPIPNVSPGRKAWGFINPQKSLSAPTRLTALAPPQLPPADQSIGAHCASHQSFRARAPLPLCAAPAHSCAGCDAAPQPAFPEFPAAHSSISCSCL